MAYNPYHFNDPESAASPDVFEPPRRADVTQHSTSSSEFGFNPTRGFIRKFDSGATRDQDTTKFDYEGFLSPLALRRFAEYMHKNRVQSDGTIRDSDNWQKGIPRSSYMKSLWRHLMTVWCHHRKMPGDDPRTGGTSGCESLEDALCGVIFNAQGYLHEIMKAK